MELLLLLLGGWALSGVMPNLLSGGGALSSHIQAAREAKMARQNAERAYEEHRRLVADRNAGKE